MRRAYLEIRRKFTRDNRNLVRTRAYTVKTSAQLSSYGSLKRIGADSAGLSGMMLILEGKGGKEKGKEGEKEREREREGGGERREN